jgi:hypothetical protein
MTPRRTVRAVLAGCALSVLLSAPDVDAQPVDAPSSIQIGASAGVVFYLPTLGARLSIPLRPPLSLEAAGEYVPLTLDDEGAAWFLFQAQLRQRLHRGQAWRVHATYGATLSGKYTHPREYRQPRPDGSVIVFPEYRRMDLAGPAGVHAGVGAERSLSDHVVVRWDVQAVVPLGRNSILAPRALFGVAWQRGSIR